MFNPYKDQANEPPMRNLICIPLWANQVAGASQADNELTSHDTYDGLIGLIKIMNKGTADKPQPWLAVDKQMAIQAQQLVAAQILHVQHEQLLYRGQMEGREMLHASVDLHIQTDLAGFVKSLHSNVCPKLQCGFLAFFIPCRVDEEQTTYTRFSGVRLEELPYKDAVVSKMEGVVSSVFRSRSSVNVGNMSKVESYNPRVDRAIGCDGRIEQILAVPVIPPGSTQPIAVLAVFNKLSGLPFSLEDENYATQLSQIGAVSLMNILAQMSLQEQLDVSKAVNETQTMEMESLTVELQHAHDSTVVLKDPSL
jgi:GAF domain-containing protein